MSTVGTADRHDSLFPTLGAAWRWWLGTLAEILPRRTENLLPRRILCASVGTSGIEVQNCGPKGSRKVASLSGASDSTGLSRGLCRRFNRERNGALVVAAEMVLRNRIELPFAAEADLQEIVGHQIDRLTPYTAEQVYWRHTVVRRDRARGRLAVDLMVVPRARVEPQLETLDLAGLHPSGLAVLDAEGKLSQFIPFRVRDAKHGSRALTVATVVLLLLNLFLLGGQFGLPLMDQMAERRDLRSQIATVRPEAEAVFRLRARADQLAAEAEFLNRKVADAPPALALLDELTAVIPDSAWLEHLQIAGGEVEIIGHAAQAAGLIGTLEASPWLEQVRFRAPVTNAGRDGRERFHIGATLNDGARP